MSTPTPDEELDAAAGALHEDMKALAELRRLISNYRSTENDYRVLAEQEEAKLAPLRAKIRGRLRGITP